MKRNKDISHILKACFLLAALVALLFVKAFHSHENEACCAEETSDVSISHSCDICNFVLSPFLEAEAPQTEVATAPCPAQIPAFASLCQSGSMATSFLRGPPTA